MKIQEFQSPFETYKVRAVLGEGGAGRVYEVENEVGETFAIKCLVPDRMTRERLKRFKNEIEFCQRADHANVVPVLDTGSIAINGARCPFYVMPRYSGTLRSKLKTIPTSDALKVFAQILSGVDAAHRMGVWHRDLKPENVLVDRSGGFVVADFGIAHFEEDDIYTAVETKDSTRLANFQYCAPEQRQRGAAVDQRVDIFALGLILNELFTGEVPHGTGYRTIGSVAPDCAYLDELVAGMLSQRPTDRPGSIDVIQRKLIGYKNEFVALQKLEAARKKVVPASSPETFVPLSITEVDYQNGALRLVLDRNVPLGWEQEFRQPRGGHSAVMGYGPDSFTIQGKNITIGVNEDAKTVRQVLDYAHGYVDSANRGYQIQISERAAREEREMRLRLQREVAEAERRREILSALK